MSRRNGVVAGLFVATLAAGCDECESSADKIRKSCIMAQACLSPGAEQWLRSQVPEAPPPEPPLECPITAVPDGITKADLEHWLRMMSPWATDQASFDLLCAELQAGLAEAIEHSADGIPPPDPTAQWVWVKVRSKHRVTIGGATGVPVGQVEQAFPCGGGITRGGGDQTTLCASTSPLPEGDYVLVAAVMGDTLRFDDAEHFHQFSFGFDSNGDAADNYVASPQYPNDFWDGLDTVLVIDDAPGAPPTLSALDLKTTPFTPLVSRARVTWSGDTLLAILPADELATVCPDHRFTSFVHLGDYGLTAPNWWAGDTEPVVHAPLEPVCTAT